MVRRSGFGGISDKNGLKARSAQLMLGTPTSYGVKVKFYVTSAAEISLSNGYHQSGHDLGSFYHISTWDLLREPLAHENLLCGRAFRPCPYVVHRVDSFVSRYF